MKKNPVFVMKKNPVFVEFEKLRKKQRKEVPAHSHESFDRHTNELIGLLQTVRKMTKTEQKAYWALVPVHKAKIGTRLRADGGFSCLKEGAIRTIQYDMEGKYVSCSAGKHYLDGQLSEDGSSYVGFYLAGEKK